MVHAKIETLGDLLKALTQLSEKQLTQKARLLSENDGILFITELTEETEDFLVNKDDEDEVGTEKELKEAQGEDFNRDNYNLVEAKGLLTLYAE